MSSLKSERLASKHDDEAAIRKLYQQMIDGWNAGNGNAFLKAVVLLEKSGGYAL